MRARLERFLRRVLFVAAPLAVGLLGAWVGMGMFAHDDVRMGPFTVRVGSALGDGGTTIALPPLGELRADTHDAPLAVRATLVDVDVAALGDELKESSTEQLVSRIEEAALGTARPFALRVLAVSALGAAVAGALVYRRRWRPAVAAIALGTIAVGLVQASAWANFDTQAFREPRFTGSLELAPQLVGPVEEIQDRIEGFRGNLERIVRGAVRAYTAIEPGAGVVGDELKVLHLSDVHLSPLGVELAVQVARGFDVDLVLDTGDLTSFGTPVEELVLSQIPRFRVPYVFVRGNHDSPTLQDAMRAIPGARVLDGDVADVEGLRIYGLGHPVFTENNEADVDQETFERRAREAGSAIRRDLLALPRFPDVVAVHDDRMAETVAGWVPLVVSGHYHRPSARVEEGTLYLRGGTAGGAGVNLFDEPGGVPLSVQILHFSRDGETRLVAYDRIVQSAETGRLVVDRHLVPRDLRGIDVLEPVPTTSPAPSPGTGAATPRPGPGDR